MAAADLPPSASRSDALLFLRSSPARGPAAGVNGKRRCPVPAPLRGSTASRQVALGEAERLVRRPAGGALLARAKLSRGVRLKALSGGVLLFPGAVGGAGASAGLAEFGARLGKDAAEASLKPVPVERRPGI